MNIYALVGECVCVFSAGGRHEKHLCLCYADPALIGGAMSSVCIKKLTPPPNRASAPSGVEVKRLASEQKKRFQVSVK